MKRTLITLAAASALMLAMAGPVAAHSAFVDPGNGAGPVVWIGGGPVPGEGGALLDSPVGKLPPSHARGLVASCMATGTNPSVVRILAPPYFTGCQHGMP